MLQNYEDYSFEERSIILASNAMDAILLLTGETGTGKSHLAMRAHEGCARRYQAKFHKINLATLSEGLIESELFGHERGSFTGADVKRVGRLESCVGGTVFLDEIGELSLRLQAKLLDFLQYKRVSPVGSNREYDVDVRIIAATNKNLDQAVERGEFRADLYHRLKVFHIQLNCLRDTPSRILPLVEQALESRAKRTARPIPLMSNAVKAILVAYPWPGNVRELEHVAEYIIGMETRGVIQPSSLPCSVRKFADNNNLMNGSTLNVVEEGIGAQLIDQDTSIGNMEFPIEMDYHASRERFERLYLERMLRICGGQINLTSRSIGLNKVSLTEKIKKYDIDWKTIKNYGPKNSNLIAE